jgi:hypothetical protein
LRSGDGGGVGTAANDVDAAAEEDCPENDVDAGGWGVTANDVDAAIMKIMMMRSRQARRHYDDDVAAAS